MQYGDCPIDAASGVDVINGIEAGLHPAKALASDSGWMFLINDANGFMQVQFGAPPWSGSDRRQAAEVMRERSLSLWNRGAAYLKFIVPEKSIVYRDYLPAALASLATHDERPAQLMEADSPAIVSYLDRYLVGLRPFGHLYFRGDTHTNWIGSWLVYRNIADKLRSLGLVNDGIRLEYSDLLPGLAGYDGDLYGQLGDAQKAEFEEKWGFSKASRVLDLTLRLAIPDAKRMAVKVDIPSDYIEWFNTRETLVYERADQKGPKAVIFRDSTSDFLTDYLAQHFSRSVFVWHQGLVYEDVIEREKPDVVLHIMAERFVTRYSVFPSFYRVSPGI